MAGSLSDYAEVELLDHIVGKTSFTMPTIYVGLWTSALSDTSTGSTAGEVSGGSYARKATVGADWAAASAGATSNANALVFPTATASWGTITHVGLFDASTAGNMIAWADLTASKTVGSGDTFQINAGDLDITLA